MSNSDEKEIFEFLDSLPSEEGTTGEQNEAGEKTESKSEGGNKGNVDGKDDILDFLDELEASKGDKKKEGLKEKVADVEVDLKEDEKSNDVSVSVSPPVADPITSIASWWSNKGSSQLSSIWGTAQSLGEDALKMAREQDLESNLKNAFKELGITGIQEDIKNQLSDEQRGELMKLSVPDAKKAIESLNLGINKGMRVVGGTLNEVIERFNAMNQRDEIIEIRLVHDMKNYLGLTNTIQHTFEDVMMQQVDGDIDVNVVESGTARSDLNTNGKNTERINLALFNGKGTDAEKLVLANIENEMRVKKNDKDTQKDESEGEGEVEGVRKSIIYMGLLAWTPKSDTESDESSKEMVIDAHSPSSFTVTCVLKDVEHGISITSHSQPLPLQWARWLEEEPEQEEGDDEESVDTGDWVIGWIRGAVSGVIGVVSQSYVIKRMGY